MNYLAHSFLSGTDDLLLVGNFVGDFVKGRNLDIYPVTMQQGLILHRFIDTYTDSSAIIKESKALFASEYGKYAGIIVDIVYDYFLSLHWNSFSGVSKDFFISGVYSILQTYFHVLPPRAQRVLYPIIYYNWLQNYGSLYGVQKVLNRMSVRTSLPNKATVCVQVLRKHHYELEQHFLAFFPGLCDAVDAEIELL
jgi:acyl carrier protein phosphodiesterase